MSLPRFHLAFPVHDLAAARRFYGGLLGCPEGRSSSAWVDFDFHGHQIVAHLVARPAAASDERTGERRTGPAGERSREPGDERNEVDGEQVPVRHFGVILDWAAWEALAARLRAAGVEFLIEPQVRFRGQVGEQATMFFRDPSGNALEIKAFRDPDAVFATDPGG